MLTFGHIVLVTVSDLAGRNPKCRPVVVISESNCTDTNENQYLCVAVTSTFTRPLDDTMVLLPWNANRSQARSGLDRECVAKCDWLLEVRESAIERVIGYVGTARLLDILAKVNSHS